MENLSLSTAELQLIKDALFENALREITRSDDASDTPRARLYAKLRQHLSQVA